MDFQQQYTSDLLCLVSCVVWWLVGSSLLMAKREKNHNLFDIIFFYQWLCMFFSFLFFQHLTFFHPYSSVCSIVAWYNPHSDNERESCLFTVCHSLSTVISGLQYFYHCSQLSCTVLCNFHMDVYDSVCRYTRFRNSVDNLLCNVKIKVEKLFVCLPFF